MHEEVKFIFKTLIKVPIIIMVSFFVFNLFVFCFVYFKMLGASYVIQQIAVENNYLPPSEITSIAKYLKTIDDSSEFIENVNIIIGASGSNYSYALKPDGTVSSSNTMALKKQQYGKEVTVGVTCNYVWVWPLDWRDNKNKAVAGINQLGKENADATGVAVPELDPTRANGASARNKLRVTEEVGSKCDKNNIHIAYTVPGLKYYPDLG